MKECRYGSVGRALASQAEGRGFESRIPLKVENQYFWWIFGVKSGDCFKYEVNT